MHWQTFKKLKDDWFIRIKEGAEKSGFSYRGNTSYFKEKVRVSGTLFYKRKKDFMRDEANIINVLDKVIIDQLSDKPRRKAAISLLPDDSEKWLEWGEIEQAITKLEYMNLRFEPVAEFDGLSVA